MAKRGERLGSQEDGRVHSEHLTVTLRRGQKAKLAKAAKDSGRGKSQLVQEALDNWVFTARNESRPKASRPGGNSR